MFGHQFLLQHGTKNCSHFYSGNFANGKNNDNTYQKSKDMKSKVRLFQLQVLCSPSIAIEPSTDREAEVIGQLELIRSLGVAADRDMHKWWAEYDQMMGNYTQIRNASICTNPDM